jgi:predicted nucleic acid-binding Zn ribbon protein
MSLKPCIYCNENISEYAVQCPKCSASSPFDQKKKEKKDSAKEAELAAKLAIEGFTKCKECGASLKIRRILDRSTVTCEKCGFPDNYIQCSCCQEKATSYDPIKKTFTCDFHSTVECVYCGKRISGSEKKFYSWYNGHCAGYGHALCCETCYDEKKHPSASSQGQVSWDPNIPFYVVIGVIVVILLMRACS